jgi:hypothetical protein
LLASFVHVCALFEIILQVDTQVFAQSIAHFERLFHLSAIVPGSGHI